MIEIRHFRSEDLDAVVELCRAEGWDSYAADPERTCHALSVAGVVSVVAVEDGIVWSFAQLLTYGAIRAYLANIVVAATKRGADIGTRLMEELFRQVKPAYIDLLSTESATSFYDALPHRRLAGYRIYRRSSE
jgi:ribosomal protein S18 acetylase RimI-like enzyme